MATCQNQVGVRNLTLGFKDCGGSALTGGGDIAARTHQMAKDNLPMYLTVPYKLEGTNRGRVRKLYENAKVELQVSRDLSIPLQWYQGRASIDYQCEHLNGSVFTGLSGFVTGVATSDGDSVTMNIEFERLEELLPNGALVQA